MERKRLYQYSFPVLLVILYLLTTGKIIPEYEAAFSSIGDYTEARDQLSEKEHPREESVKIKRRLNKLQNDLKQVQLAIPLKGHISEPLAVIDSLLKKNDVKLNDIQRLDSDSAKQYEIVSVKLGAKGVYKNLRHFIKDLENSPVIIYVTGYDIKLSSMYRREIEAEIFLDVVFKQQ